MVDFASLGIPVVPFAPVCRPGLGLAVTSLGVLRAFGEGEFFASPHRLDFHQVMLVTEGGGHYSIDSDRFAIRPGTLLWTRPNQVVQFVPDPEMNADVIMFTEAFPLSMSAHMGLLDDVLRPSHWRLREGELAAFRRVLDLLREEFTRPDQGLGEELLKHLLAVVLLHIDQMCRLRHKEKTTAFSGEHGELFLRFRRELDRSFATTRLVEEYAAALRCSTRALSRA